MKEKLKEKMSRHSRKLATMSIALIAIMTFSLLAANMPVGAVDGASSIAQAYEEPVQADPSVDEPSAPESSMPEADVSAEESAPEAETPDESLPADESVNDESIADSSIADSSEEILADEEEPMLRAGGAGTQANPYIIETAEELYNLALATNAGHSYAGQYIALGNDIDISAYSWPGIGDRSSTLVSGSYNKPFSGNFDGRGFTITGLRGTDPRDWGEYGLFGRTEGGSIRNINLVLGGDLSASYDTGAMVGHAVNGTVIENCHVDGKGYTIRVTGGGRAGGFIGWTNGGTGETIQVEITGCSVKNINTITSGNYSAGFIGVGRDAIVKDCFVINEPGNSNVGTEWNGGFAGVMHNNTVTSNCYVISPNVTGNSSGGFAGSIYVDHGSSGDAYIDNCYAIDPFVYGRNYYVGGFAGKFMQDRVYATNCYAAGGKVSTDGYAAGGFAGDVYSDWQISATIVNCYAQVDVDSKGAYAGGFIGVMTNGVATLKNCYSTGSVKSGSTDGIGGFIGYVMFRTVNVENCYATGTVLVSNTNAANVGGFIGRNTSGSVFTNCFYDTTTTRMTKASGGSAASGIIGYNTTDMTEINNFSGTFGAKENFLGRAKGVGTDESPWYIDDDITYPYFYYQFDGHTKEETDYFVAHVTYADKSTVVFGRTGRKDFEIKKQSDPLRVKSVNAVKAYFPYSGTSRYDIDNVSYQNVPGSTNGLTHSLGGVSMTNIIAFDSGPYASKNNNSREYSKGVDTTYTWVGDKITYRIRLTNYHIYGDWKDIEIVDPLAKGVTLVNDYVFLYTGRLPDEEEKPTVGNDLAGVTETHVKNYTGQTPPADDVPYFIYEKATSGDNAGQYVLSIYNLPDVSYAKIDPSAPPEQQFVLDGYYIEFVAQVEEGALTPAGQYPEDKANWTTNTGAINEKTYPHNNIRNKGVVSGNMYLWDPEQLFDQNGSSMAENKHPLLGEDGKQIIYLVDIDVDDEDQDPVYKDKIVTYVNNHRNYDETLTDFQIDKDYMLSNDPNKKHEVIPNDDPNDPSVKPHERKDYAGFAAPRQGFKFDGWFYFVDEADAATYRNRSAAQALDKPDTFGEIRVLTLDDIAIPTILDPATDTVVKARNITIFAIWKNGVEFDFTKYDSSGGMKNDVPESPLSGAGFSIYYWMGKDAPTGDDSLVDVVGKSNITTDNQTEQNKWLLQKVHNKEVIYSQGDGVDEVKGLVELVFAENGHYNVVEVETPTGFYAPDVQWRVVINMEEAGFEDKPKSVSTVFQEDGLNVVNLDFIKEVGKDANGKDIDLWYLPNHPESDFDFIKIDRDTKAALAGVEFKMYLWLGTNAPANNNLITDTNIGTVADMGTDKWMLFNTSTTAADGLVNVLMANNGGYYQLVETKTVDGYALPHGQWRLTFDNSGNKALKIDAIKSANGDVPPAFKTNASGVYELMNYKLGELPLSGAINHGIIALTIVSVVIIATGIILITLDKRRKMMLASAIGTTEYGGGVSVVHTRDDGRRCVNVSDLNKLTQSNLDEI